MILVAQEDSWFSFETSVTGDFIKNIKGGIARDYTYIGMEEASLTFDLAKMGLWKGAELFLHGINTHGILPSEQLTGDLQVFSNIESGNYTGFYEYYIKQTINKFSVLIGQHDLNSEFVGTEFGGVFINSSFGIAPSVSLNVPVSIYPLAAPAIVFSYNFNPLYDVKLGIYDGNPGDPKTNRYNLQPNIDLDEGLLVMGQLEWHRSVNDKPENCKIGGYYHSSKFQNYKDTNNYKNGNFGLFAITDLVLISNFNKPHQYFSAFVQGGFAPESINQVNYYIGGGLHLNGILPKRYNDVVGLAFAYAHIGSSYRAIYQETLSSELAVEFTYKFSVFDYYTIQPNIQYLINPGVNSNVSNSLVAIVRFNISLFN
jgi:porin